MPETLHAPMKVEFDYTRSLGPVLSAFMTGLRERQILGGRTSDGRVVVPPPEFDPATHRAVTEFVPVAQTGTVQSWSWVGAPVADQPFEHPFAFALVLLDGADSPLLHAVDAGSPSAMSTGMRVRARWAEDPRGSITDIVCFDPEPATSVSTSGAGAPCSTSEPPVSTSGASAPCSTSSVPAVEQRAPASGVETPPPPAAPPVTGLITPVRLDYDYAASPEESKFFRGLAEGRLLGQRCPACHKVYVPPRGACPVDGVPTTDEVELTDRGTVTTFCIVNVPFLGQAITPPYVSAYVLLDGADIAFLHLILDVEAAEVRMGMRVEAVWKPREEWGTTIANISHFRPTGEPDADYESYRQHL